MPESLVRLDLHPLADQVWRQRCREQLHQSGALVLRQFLQPHALEAIIEEGIAQRHLAYHTRSKHNVYLMKPDDAFSADHPRNRNVLSTKGCITDDVIAVDSPLRQLYNDDQFKRILTPIRFPRSTCTMRLMVRSWAGTSIIPHLLSPCLTKNPWRAGYSSM